MIRLQRNRRTTPGNIYKEGQPVCSSSLRCNTMQYGDNHVRTGTGIY